MADLSRFWHRLARFIWQPGPVQDSQAPARLGSTVCPLETTLHTSHSLPLHLLETIQAHRAASSSRISAGRVVPISASVPGLPMDCGTASAEMWFVWKCSGQTASCRETEIFGLAAASRGIRKRRSLPSSLSATPTAFSDFGQISARAAAVSASACKSLPAMHRKAGISFQAP